MQHQDKITRTTHFFIDWIPYPSCPIKLEVYNPEIVTSKNFYSFFKQRSSPGFSPVEFSRKLENSLECFGYCMRNDGIIVYWLNFIHDKKVADSMAFELANELSYGIKEKLNHRHAFHGKGPGIKGAAFRPVAIPDISSSIPEEFSSLLESHDCPVALKNWSTLTIGDKIKELLNSDPLLRLLKRLKLEDTHIDRVAILSLRDEYSKVFNSVFVAKDAIRTNFFIYHSTSFGAFFVTCGLITPFFVQNAIAHEVQSYEFIPRYLAFWLSQFVAYVFLLLAAERLITFVAKDKLKFINFYEFLKRLVFAEHSTIKRKLIFPLFVAFGIVAAFITRDINIPFFTIVEDFAPESKLGMNDLKAIFTNTDNLIIISFVLVFGVLYMGTIEIAVKRLRILKMVRYGVACLNFGDVFGDVCSNIMGGTYDKKYRYDKARDILNVFLSHEKNKLYNACVIIPVILFIACIPMFIALAQ